MVRNIQGGTGTKGLARKHQDTGKSYRKLRISEDPDEIYAYVEKPYGNGMCLVVSNNGTEYVGHIRGKMRGKHKRSNLVEPSCIVLVGLRSWESDTNGKKRNCDIITVYDDNDIQQLQQLPNISIDAILSKIISQKTKNAKSIPDLENEVEFSREQEEYSGGSGLPEMSLTEAFTVEEVDKIDISDI